MRLWCLIQRPDRDPQMYVGSETHEKSVRSHHLVPYVGAAASHCDGTAPNETIVNTTTPWTVTTAIRIRYRFVGRIARSYRIAGTITCLVVERSIIGRHFCVWIFRTAGTFGSTYRRVLRSTAVVLNVPVQAESGRRLPDGCTFDPRRHGNVTPWRGHGDGIRSDGGRPALRVQRAVIAGKRSLVAPVPAGPVGLVGQLQSTSPLLSPSQLKWQTH